MKQVVELTAEGAIQLPAEMLSQIKPQSRFVIENYDGTLVLRPAEREPYFWETATPEERIADFRKWMERVRAIEPERPPLPDEALRRESMYNL